MSAKSDVPTPPIGPIVQPYLLALFSVPFHVGNDGRRYLDPLWAKDLIEHTRYIESLTLAAPVRHGPLPPNAVAMDDMAALRTIHRVELPAIDSHVGALRQLPRLWRILWAESGKAQLIHSGVAGWPLPEAWLLTPIAWLRRRVHYINVESAFWRLTPGEPATRRRRLLAWVKERLNRWCVGSADLSTFTQEGYRSSLLHRHRERGHVFEASWIDADNILPPSQLDSTLRARAAEVPLRMVFAGRLTNAKGVRLMMDAVLPLVRTGHAIELDIYGDGPLAQECATLLGDPSLARRVRLRGSVPYDAAFFETLRGFHLLIVPTLSDEQPRIVFDAYSQGLPVLASDTAGMRQCVEDGITGAFFTSGDVDALRDAIVHAAAHRTEWARMASACVELARASTHQEMHRKRWRLLVTTFPALARR